MDTDLFLDSFLGGRRGTFGALDLGGREDGRFGDVGVLAVGIVPVLKQNRASRRGGGPLAPGSRRGGLADEQPG